MKIWAKIQILHYFQEINRIQSTVGFASSKGNEFARCNI